MENWENRDWLLEQHITNRKSITAIAKMCHKRVDTVRSKIVSFGIPIWSPTDKYIKISKEDEEEILHLYFDKGQSTTEIGEKYKIDNTRVARIIKKHGKQCRTLSESQFVNLGKAPDPRLFDKEWLRGMHWDQNISCKELGKILGSDPDVVRDHMHKLGIETKSNAESKTGLMAGEKHPNWKGGKTPLSKLLREYFNINLAPIAAKRDSYTCTKCGKEHTILNVHHIRPFAEITQEILSEHSELSPVEDKQVLYDIIVHDDRFLNINNLTTLCKECHKKEHSKKTLK